MKRRSKLPKSTKTVRSHVPQPQRERIVTKFISGMGIRRISREERRSRETVTKIVRSGDVQKYVTEMRAAYFGMGMEALEALRRAIRTSTDGKLAHQLLMDIGVVPRQGDQIEAREPQDQDEEKQIQIVMAKLIQVAKQRSTVFGTSMGQIDVDLRAAGGRLNRTTGAVEAAPVDVRISGARKSSIV